MLCLRVSFYVIITFVYQNLKGLVDVSKYIRVLFVLSTHFYSWLIAVLPRAFYKLVLQTFQPQRGCSAAVARAYDGRRTHRDTGVVQSVLRTPYNELFYKNGERK